MVWFGLNPHKALHYHLFFWLAALLPPLLGAAISISMMHPLDFSWSYKGLTFWVDNNKLPIGIMALGIPFGVMVGSFHKTLQTAEQIKQSELHNSYRNFLDHKDGVVKKLLENVSELHGDEHIARKIYDYFYPDSSPENAGFSTLSCCLKKDAIESISKIHKSFSLDFICGYTERVKSVLVEEDNCPDNKRDKSERALIDFLVCRIEALIDFDVYFKGFSAELGVFKDSAGGWSSEGFVYGYDFFCKLLRIVVSESLDGGKGMSCKAGLSLDFVSYRLFCVHGKYLREAGDQLSKLSKIMMISMDRGALYKYDSVFIDRLFPVGMVMNEGVIDVLSQYKEYRPLMWKKLVDSGMLVSQEFMSYFEEKVEDLKSTK